MIRVLPYVEEIVKEYPEYSFLKDVVGIINRTVNKCSWRCNTKGEEEDIAQDLILLAITLHNKIQCKEALNRMFQLHLQDFIRDIPRKYQGIFVARSDMKKARAKGEYVEVYVTEYDNNSNEL